MDSLTDGTASLLRYDDCRRQLDLFCVIGVHSSVRYAGARSLAAAKKANSSNTSIIVLYTTAELNR